MVQEAEKYKAEDDVQRDKVSAKNGLESYAFNMKSTVEDEKLAGKIGDDDKQKILDKCNEVISWLDKNQVGSCDSACVFSPPCIHLNILLYIFRLLREMSTSISKRNWRRCATPSSQRCTRLLEACLVVCQRACQVASLELAVQHLEVDPLAQPLRKLTKHAIVSAIHVLRSKPSYSGSKLKSVS